MPKITKRTVDALKPHERERVVWDDDLKEFRGHKLRLNSRYVGMVWPLPPRDTLSGMAGRRVR